MSILETNVCLTFKDSVILEDRPDFGRYGELLFVFDYDKKKKVSN